MDLALSPEQQEVRTLAREFAEREVKPRAEAIDHNSEFPRDLVDKAARLGLLGVLVPDAYGGAGLDHGGFAVFVGGGAPFCARPPGLLAVHKSGGPQPAGLLWSQEQEGPRLP